jgi:SAM-dependent methyltransferase
MDEADWEAHFRAVAAAGAEPNIGRPDPLVEQIVGRFLPARALDLACGAGANALWLAERGWDVTAVDRSTAAVELVRANALRRGLRVTTQVADLETHAFKIAPGAWDSILMCRYLQRDLFEPAKLGLAPGGVLIVIALLSEPGKDRFRVQPGELATYFGGSAGWKIIYLREGATREHKVAEIVVRRDG